MVVLCPCAVGKPGVTRSPVLPVNPSIPHKCYHVPQDIKIVGSVLLSLFAFIYCFISCTVCLL